MARHIKKHEVKAPVAKCEHCTGNIFKLRTRFCSLSCAAKFNNARKIKRASPKMSRSRAITVSVRRQNWLAAWLAGTIPMEETYGGIFNQPSSMIRRYLIEKNGECCHKCGWREVNHKTGKVPVQLNHIDGDSTNNSPSNVELLCPNCHSLTPTFGCHGKGRKKRGWAKAVSVVANEASAGSIPVFRSIN